MQRCRRVKAEVPDAPALLPFNRVGEQLPLRVISRHQRGDEVGPLCARRGRSHELGDPTELPRLYVRGQPRLCEEFHMSHGSSGIKLWHAILGDKVR